MMLKRTILLIFMFPLGINCFDYTDEMLDNDLSVREEFLSFDDIMNGATAVDHQSLRGGRGLQTSTCRATSPRNIYVCGTPGMPNDSCQTSSASCSGMTYSCSCNGSGETSCSYCRAQTSNAVICQVTGSSMTYALPSTGMTTCSCEYIGNGQVRHTCFQPSPRPVALPTFFPAQPTTARTPTNSYSLVAGGLTAPASTVVVQVPAAPVAVQPGTSATKNNNKF